MLPNGIYYTTSVQQQLLHTIKRLYYSKPILHFDSNIIYVSNDYARNDPIGTMYVYIPTTYSIVVSLQPE